MKRQFTSEEPRHSAELRHNSELRHNHEPRHELRHDDRSPARSRDRRLRLAAILFALAACALTPAAAQAAAPLTWSPPVSVDPGQTPSAIACPSEALCVAVDRGGNVLHTTSAPASPGPTWSQPHQIDAGRALSALSCAPSALCAAVDETGAVVASAEPAGSPSTWQRTSIDSQPLTGISCPSAALCVAVDQAGSALASNDPGAPNPSWTATAIDSGNHLRAISCPTQSLCVAVDAAGRVLTSTDPGAPNPGWQVRAIDPAGEPVAVSCGSAQLCVATDSAGNALASADPGAAAPTWNATQIELTGPPTSISCATSGLCVSLDAHGSALASDNPASGLPSWNGSGADPGASVAGVSCLPGGVCMAIDSAGRFVRATVEAPLAVTDTALEIGSNEATLTATVNPHDAVLGGCRFEYGSTSAYEQNAGCISLPSPTGGQQTVQARISGLAPASTYHFRILAANAGGPGVGGDVSFTTAPAVSIVYPNPYILGIPANGERLYCEPGTSGSATISYAWVRDTTVISSATGSSYVVTGADAQHHLQCRVTATNSAGSATASSAFVAVPAGGILAAAGETKIGKITASATAIIVPVTCSPQAPVGCAIAVRVTTTQTRSAGKGKPARRETLTLAGASTHLKRSERRTLTLALNAADRRLLTRVHRLTASVSVSGTVIGELKASLANLRLTLRDPPRHGRAAGRARSTTHARAGTRALSTKRGRAATHSGSRGRSQ